MDTRYTSHARRRARGAIRPAAIAIVAVVAALAAASWFLIIKPHQDLLDSETGAHPSTPVATGQEAPPPPANVAAMSVNQLLLAARKSMNEQRILAPAGNNAFEFYLKALEKQPGNQVAADALRETFPVGASLAEQAINQRDLSDAQRQIDLLAKADPANYTLTILRSKLDAQRKLQDREQQQALDKEKQTQLAAQKAAEKAEADRQAAEAQQKAQADQRAAQARVAQQSESNRQQQASTSAQSSGDSAAAGGTHGAVLVRNVNPRYPVNAMRANQEGWVEVTFTITPEGNVDNVKVLDAEPRHVFDRAAVEAVTRWKYQPATQDGSPIASQDKRRIVFKLN